MTYEAVDELVKIHDTPTMVNKDGVLHVVSSKAAIDAMNKAMQEGKHFEVTTKVTFN